MRWLLVVAGASKTARMSAPARLQPGQFLAGQPDWVPGAGGGQVGLGAGGRGQALFQPGLQGAGDQPVARLDLVVLAHGPVRFEPGPLGREFERGDLVAVGLPGVGQGPRGGLQRGRGQYLEQLVEHGAVQVHPAGALARRGAIQVGAAAAQVPGRAAVPGVADLHHPAALAAPQQAGQQRRALAGGAAAVPARRLAVGLQPGLDVLPGVPVHITGVVAGDQHLPLVLRQHPLGAGHLARGVRPLFGAGAAEHVRAGIGRGGQEAVDRGIGRRGPGDPPRAVLAAGQQQPPLPQRHHHLPGRAELGEQGIHLADRRADRLVIGQHDLPVVVVVQPDRQQAGAARRGRPCAAAPRSAASAACAALPRPSAL